MFPTSVQTLDQPKLRLLNGIPRPAHMASRSEVRSLDHCRPEPPKQNRRRYLQLAPDLWDGYELAESNKTVGIRERLAQPPNNVDLPWSGVLDLVWDSASGWARGHCLGPD